MRLAEFEPAIPAVEWPQNYAFKRTVTVIILMVFTRMLFT
jgi:hypothetical protein